MTVRTVCFDLDDTLYDYTRYARAGLRAAAEVIEERFDAHQFASGRDDDVEDQLLDLYFDEGVTEGTFDAFVDRHDLPETIVPELVDAFHDASTPLLPYPNTGPVLSTLAGEYSLGLITDGRGGRAKLDRLGIGGYFDAVLVTPTIGRSKRDPVVFDMTLGALSARRETTMYVGDDPRVDFAVPNDLGMTTVRLRRGRYSTLDPGSPRARPDYELSDLDELPSLLDSCNARDRTVTRASDDVRARPNDDLSSPEQ